jgi:hypothetical protein
LRSVRAVRSPPALLLPDVVVSVEGLAPIVLLLPELPVPEAPIEVLPLVDESVLAVLPVVPLVEPAVEPLVLGEALGVAVELLPALGVGLVIPPLLVPAPPAPEAPVDPDDAPAAPDDPLAPEPEPAPPEL